MIIDVDVFGKEVSDKAAQSFIDYIHKIPVGQTFGTGVAYLTVRTAWQDHYIRQDARVVDFIIGTNYNYAEFSVKWHAMVRAYQNGDAAGHPTGDILRLWSDEWTPEQVIDAARKSAIARGIQLP